ncbi:oxidoreductase, partial [Mycobacterium tuberculosis]|nr:oxidoreductase [Mycobacterium tuberculosis]
MLDSRDTSTHGRGKDSVAQVNACHHRRRSPHSTNILVSVDDSADVVVVGAGPAGSAAAAWAA